VEYDLTDPTDDAAQLTLSAPVGAAGGIPISITVTGAFNKDNSLSVTAVGVELGAFLSKMPGGKRPKVSGAVSAPNVIPCAGTRPGCGSH
jgi:hypothetical protein